MDIVVILLLACVTFTMRYLFFIQSLPFRIGPNMHRILGYTAPCILTAMAAPIIFGDAVSKHEVVGNPYLMAGIISILLSLTLKNTLLVVVLSMVTFSLWKYLHGALI